MKYEYIVKTIESILNGEDIEFDFSQASFDDSDVGHFCRNTTIRLINAYKDYIVSSNTVDILGSIRNFMLVFNNSFRLKSIEIPKDNQFGLYLNAADHRYYASIDAPDYIQHTSFIKDAFVCYDHSNPQQSSKYCLKTNGFIEELTGFKHFKSLEQKLCVYGALNTPAGYTTLVSMPTGGGKSLITQAIAYEGKSLTIVVVPTVSLAIDQERTARKNIKNAKDDEIFGYYSGIKNQEAIFNAITKRKARLLFISPEALIKNERFKQVIAEANSTRYFRNLIIDEAHIVVAWGDFFRVDYQCLNPWRKDLLIVNPSIRTYLLSATFRENTVSILKQMFSTGNNWIELRCDSLRKEPRFVLDKVKSFNEKKQHFIELVKKLPRPIIIYVSNPDLASYWKAVLEGEGFGNINTFTGDTDSDTRSRLIDEWSRDCFDIMIATSAFGVGVDKPDVRSVLHLYVPETPDAYYQELGRGGRDGLPCLSVMCITDKDIVDGEKHVPKVLLPDTLWGRWWSMFTNQKNDWIDNKMTIIASTKPNYNKTNYFEEGNDTDEKWNINALLLLDRYKLIEIVSLDLDNNNRYIFTIRVINDLLLTQNKEAIKLIETVREKEAEKAQKSYRLIKESIAKDKTVCWSEMFYSTYKHVSEYCSGCNNHDYIINEEPNRFPLLSVVSKPERSLSANQLSFFGSTKEALVITKKDYVATINNYLPDIVVSDSFTKVDLLDNPMIIVMNFNEFRDLLVRDNGFYISGVIMVIYDSDEAKQKKEYQIVRNYSQKGKYVIHVSNNDFIVSTTSEKKLSSIVAGAVIND